MSSIRLTVASVVASVLRVTVSWLCLAVVFTGMTRICPGYGTDLIQDYAAALVWLDGGFAYTELATLHARIGIEGPDASVRVRHNPHPPAAILVTVPFAWQVPEFAKAIWLFPYWQLGFVALGWHWARSLVPRPVNPWLWAILGSLIAVWTPLWQGLQWGQPGGLLLLLAVGTWQLARGEARSWGYALAFGLIFGLACALRPYFAMLVVVISVWPWRKVAAVVAMLAILALVPFAIVGITPLGWYQIATESERYIPEAASLVGPLHGSAAAGVTIYLLLTLMLGWARWRGLSTDATLALGLPAILISYPLSWYYYDVILVPVLVWLLGQAIVLDSRRTFWLGCGFVLLTAPPDLMPTPAMSSWLKLYEEHQPVSTLLARFLLLFAVANLLWERRDGLRSAF